MYLAKNQDKHTMSLSSKDFMAWSGEGRTAYTTAFNELVDNGFLKKVSSSKNGHYYEFYDIPITDEPIQIKINKTSAREYNL